MLAEFSHEFLDSLVIFGQLPLSVGKVGIQRPWGGGAMDVQLLTDVSKDGIKLPQGPDIGSVYPVTKGFHKDTGRNWNKNFKVWYLKDLNQPQS